MADQKDQKVKVRILKPVGPYLPGQEVEVDSEMAVHMADGVKAMLVSDYEKKQAAGSDLSKLSVQQMNDMKLKNVPEDAKVYAVAESAALNGKPVATGEPITVTGGVTPPTTVFPAMADAAGHAVTSVDEAKPAKKDEGKKPAAKDEKK